MQTFLLVLIILAAIGALVSVVRGVVIFLQANHRDVVEGRVPENGLAQNRMMWRRVQFQAVAVLLVVVFLLVARSHTG